MISFLLSSLKTLTDFRMHPDYVMYYMFWSKFVLVEMIPYVTIIVLNTAIMLKIRKSRWVQNICSLDR